MIFGNSVLVNKILEKAERKPYFQHDIAQPYEYGIVLGGGFIGKDKGFPDRFIFGESANRLTEALELYHSGKIKKMIISGGAGGIGRIKNVEAVHAGDFLREIHTPDSCLIIEAESKNTYENAAYVKKILDSIDYDGKILLITSALHMHRALATFHKMGIDAVAYPADYDHKSEFELWDYILPDVETLHDWQMIFKEWVGYYVYKSKGYL